MPNLKRFIIGNIITLSTQKNALKVNFRVYFQGYILGVKKARYKLPGIFLYQNSMIL